MRLNHCQLSQWLLRLPGLLLPVWPFSFPLFFWILLFCQGACCLFALFSCYAIPPPLVRFRSWLCLVVRGSGCVAHALLSRKHTDRQTQTHRQTRTHTQPPSHTITHACKQTHTCNFHTCNANTQTRSCGCASDRFAFGSHERKVKPQELRRRSFSFIVLIDFPLLLAFGPFGGGFSVFLVFSVCFLFFFSVFDCFRIRIDLEFDAQLASNHCPCPRFRFLQASERDPQVRQRAKPLLVRSHYLCLYRVCVCVCVC